MHPSVRRDPQENTRCDAMRCDAMRCDAMPAAKQGENSWQGGDGGGRRGRERARGAEGTGRWDDRFSGMCVQRNGTARRPRMTPPVRMHDLEGDEGPGEGPALFEAVVEDRISHPADRPEEGDARMPGLIKIARSRSRTRIDAGNYRTIVSSNEFSLSLSLSLSLFPRNRRVISLPRE